MTTLIERNTTIPCTKSETYSTAENNQTMVAVHVLQGERQFAKDNKTLGQFNLMGLPPAPRGVPQIEVQFDIDANGIVSVNAKDRATGREQSITITGGSSLTESEINTMIQDAKQYAEEDEAKKLVIEAQNNLNNLIYQTEKFVKENEGYDLSAELDAAKEVENADDVEALKNATTTLETALHAAVAAAYQEPPQESNASDDENVIDAEFEENP